ncbi:MAG: pyridoxal phosphate-dependent aminotransferase [Candidatus Tectomicrobia bacterium]|uniref:Aminotransferase n=1 Tax=Tectimicrobiota bacterium TaxID=2528274 RepID=A0A932ZW25_UNCTE|nr:pyridoxal phosphate-dependent aminotransferase [Candidatus Tectomicrobia bacterium]
MRLAIRMSKLPPSPTLAMNAKAAELRAQGKDVISFAAGEPDFDTPDHIKEAAVQALKEGKTKYTEVRGVLPLREAVCDWVAEHKGLRYDPKRQVVVSVGGKQAVFNLLHVLLEEGDEVVIPAPIWVAYEPVAVLAGARVVLVQASEESGFKLTPGQLKRAITPRTKLVVLNSPCNPTGCVYTRRELEAIAQIVLASGAMVLSDEIYGKILYDGEEHVSIASLSPEMKARTLVLDGFSKTYAMTGWRLGYTLGPAPIIEAMDTLQSQSTSNAVTFAQWAGVAALRGPHGFLKGWVAEYDRRRRAVVEGLNAVEGLSALAPKGAFYVFPRVSGLFGRKGPAGPIRDSNGVGLYLLEHAQCACVPGIGFGDDAFIRLSYATSYENVEKGVERIRAAVGQLG